MKPIKPYKFRGHRPESHIVRFHSKDPGVKITFRGAVSHDRILDIFEETTPYSVEFLATTVIVLFESMSNGHALRVELVREDLKYGPRTAMASGRAGRIIEDPYLHIHMAAGTG